MWSPTTLCIVVEFGLERLHTLERKFSAATSELAGRVYRRHEIFSAAVIMYL